MTRTPYPQVAWSGCSWRSSRCSTTGPYSPTRRIALGRRHLPTDPPPGFGAGAARAPIAAVAAEELDGEDRDGLRRLMHRLEVGQRVPAAAGPPPLPDRHPRPRPAPGPGCGAAARTSARLRRRRLAAAADARPRCTPPGSWALAMRPRVFDVIRRGLAWRGPIGPGHLPPPDRRRRPAMGGHGLRRPPDVGARRPRARRAGRVGRRRCSAGSASSCARPTPTTAPRPTARPIASPTSPRPAGSSSVTGLTVAAPRPGRCCWRRVPGPTATTRPRSPSRSWWRRCPSPAWTSPTARPGAGPPTGRRSCSRPSASEAAALVAAGRRAARPPRARRPVDGRAHVLAWRSPTACRPPALVLLSYPLHPPGQARQAAHRAPAAPIAVPMPGRLRHQGPVRHARRARPPPRRPSPRPVTYVWVEGAGHDWKRRDAPGRRGRRRLAPRACRFRAARALARWNRGPAHGVEERSVDGSTARSSERSERGRVEVHEARGFTVDAENRTGVVLVTVEGDLDVALLRRPLRGGRRGDGAGRRRLPRSSST